MLWNNRDESGDDENNASAGTSEDQANPSSAKRQRRPNVRLEELASPSRKKKTDKTLRTVSNGGLHKQNSLDVGDDAQRADNALPDCVNALLEPCPKANKLQQILKITGKKVRNVGRKPKVGASVKKLPSVPRSGASIRAHCKQKVPCMQDAEDMHFDKENNTHRFEASGYQGVIFPFERQARGDTVLLHSHQNFQSGDYLPEGAQVDGKRMSHANLSLHVPKGKLVVKANGSMHGIRNKLVVEANGNGNSREPSKKSALRQYPRPWLGVREWLHHLGLGKYANIFEAHEVEPEVLPLLTLDDLREMGVAAVGSRRKMFSAIQHIRKALLAESE